MELFTYNREGFMFDKEQMLKRAYQEQNMRITQFEMYREDVSDLVNMTVSKMDNYLLINTLMFGFCVILLTEGRPKSTPAEWLLWLYGMTTIGALMYIILGTWLAVHASISAHSFGVRMLTQFVRLPVPSKQQMDAARAFATDYEGSGVTDMLRVPILEGQLNRMNDVMEQMLDNGEVEEDEETDAGPPGSSPAVTLKHFRLFRQLQANWQAYDAYTRVCMSVGVNQLLHACSYSSLVILVHEEGSPWPAMCVMVVLASCSWLVSRLDLFLSRRMLTLVGALVALPPVLCTVAITIEVSSKRPLPDAPWSKIDQLLLNGIKDILVPVVYALHTLWLMLILKFAKADHLGDLSLPTTFRSVLYLDVFGWMGLPSSPSRQVSGMITPVGAAAAGLAAGGVDRRDSTALSVVPEESEVAGAAEGDDFGQRTASAVGLVRQTSTGGTSFTGHVFPEGLGGEVPGVDFLGELEDQMRRTESRTPAGRSFRAPGTTFEGSTPMGRSFRGVSAATLEGTTPTSFWAGGARPPSAPDSLRSSLDSLLQRLLADFTKDLERWETDAISDLIRGDYAYEQGVREYRERLGRVIQQLKDKAPEIVQPPPSTSAPPQSAVWLALEWNPSGTPMQYYCDSSTGQCVWSRPCGSQDRVVEFDGMGLQLTDLEEKAQAAVGFREAAAAEAAAVAEEAALAAAAAAAAVEEAARSEEAAKRSRQAAAHAAADGATEGLPLQEPSRDSQAESIASSFRQSSGSSFRQMTAVGDDRRQGHQQPPAEGQQTQETQFGGRESVQLSENPQLRRRFFESSSFHPHRQIQEGDHHPYRTRAQRKPPGQIPWRTFRRSSRVLIGMWCLGSVWATSRVLFGFEIPVRKRSGEGPEPGEGTAAALGGAVPVFASQWPDRLFRPVHLACHAELGAQVLLVGDKFAIHELRLPADAEAISSAQAASRALRPALGRCLAAAPELHGGGIRALALDCAPQSNRSEFDHPAAGVEKQQWQPSERCAAVLLGSAGSEGRALRCPIGDDADVDSSADGGAALLRLHGGPWRSLASAAGDAGELWGQEDGGRLVRLRPLDSGAPREMVPQLEVAWSSGPPRQGRREREAEEPQVQLVLEGEDLHLALDGELLVARSLQTGSSEWSAPLPPKVAWSAACATGRVVYLLGDNISPAPGARQAGIWKITLPQADWASDVERCPECASAATALY